jgi:hypothetical protein
MIRRTQTKFWNNMEAQLVIFLKAKFPARKIPDKLR